MKTKPKNCGACEHFDEIGKDADTNEVQGFCMFALPEIHMVNGKPQTFVRAVPARWRCANFARRGARSTGRNA